MIVGKKRNDHRKETGFQPFPELNNPLTPGKFALPVTQIKAFIDGLTVREARDVGLNLGLAILAATYMEVQGASDEQVKKNLALIRALAREHPNKRYRNFMSAICRICESEERDLVTAMWTLMEAFTLLCYSGPDWDRMVKVYGDRMAGAQAG